MKYPPSFSFLLSLFYPNYSILFGTPIFIHSHIYQKYCHTLSFSIFFLTVFLILSRRTSFYHIFERVSLRTVVFERILCDGGTVITLGLSPVSYILCLRMLVALLSVPSVLPYTYILPQPKGYNHFSFFSLIFFLFAAVCPLANNLYFIKNRV